VQTVIGIRGTLVFLLIYAALGFPESHQCLADGGHFGSCVYAGIFVGALKSTFYILGAAIGGLSYLFGG
jgi:hypothetical protein